MSKMEIFVEDYTSMPGKTKTRKGETGECPQCKRIGVIETRNGKISYFHRLGYKLETDESLPEVIDDTCNLH
jgi:hypothetical protein